MKRKRLNRDCPKSWGFGGFPYHQVRVDVDGFNGLVCLIEVGGGNNDEYIFWDFPLAGKTPVCGGDGMTWLQIIPEGGQHILTAKMLLNDTVSVWYADIIDRIEYDEDGVAVFIDMYLDVIFTPQGDLTVDDRNELDEAFITGDISNEQHKIALKECDLVIGKYCTNLGETEILCNKILSRTRELVEVERGNEK